MPRAQGFARGDLDTSFPLDDKFLALRRLPPERYYAATGVYFHIVAATWREAERKPAAKVCPDADAEVADLQSVGLLDSDGCVQRRAFTHSVGRAKANRRATADRVARHRAGKSPVSNANKRGRNALSVVPVGTVVTGEDGSNAREVDDAPPLTRVIDYVEERTGRPWAWRPGSKTWDTLEADVRQLGEDAVLDAMRRVSVAQPDHGQLIFGASRILHPIESPKPSSKEDRERAEARRALGLA